MNEHDITEPDASMNDSERGCCGGDCCSPDEDPMGQLRAQLDEAVAARQRALADFRNFQRRADENEIRARQQGIQRVVRSLIPVLDQFELALGQPGSTMTVEQLRSGVKLVGDELNKALESVGVTPITASPGDEFNPQRHEAVMRQASKDVPPDHVVAMFQRGYAVGDMVLRPAKVAVAPSAEEASTSS